MKEYYHLIVNWYRYFENFKGKKWYAATIFVFSLAFSDVRSGMLSKIDDMSDFLIWFAHAPETLLGKWTLIAFAFIFMSVGIWQGSRHRKISQRREYTEVQDVFNRPNRLIELCVSQYQLRVAGEYLDQSPHSLKNYREEINKLKNGGKITAYDFNIKIDEYLQMARNFIEPAIYLSSPDWDNIDFKQPTGKQTSGSEWYPNFLPSENEEFFLQHEHNLLMLEKAAGHLVPWVKNKLQSVDFQIKSILNI